MNSGSPELLRVKRLLAGLGLTDRGRGGKSMLTSPLARVSTYQRAIPNLNPVPAEGTEAPFGRRPNPNHNAEGAVLIFACLGAGGGIRALGRGGGATVPAERLRQENNRAAGRARLPAFCWPSRWSTADLDVSRALSKV